MSVAGSPCDTTLQAAPPVGDPEIDAMRPWFHNLHLADGRQTSPHHRLGDFPRNKWDRLAPHLPPDMTGWRVLDVGCNAGFYAFALAARGADVTASDVEEHYLRQGRWAAERMVVAGRVTFQREGVWEVLERGERYDLILFMGLFYHLRYPLLALDGLAALTERLLVFQTLTADGAEVRPGAARETLERETPEDVPYEEGARLLSPSWPSMAFIEHAFAGDSTNWWVPTGACAEAMVRSAGLRVQARFDVGAFVCAPGGPGAANEHAGALRVAHRLDVARRQPTQFDHDA